MRMSIENDKKILVSVIVVTYNSADYIIETLESIKMQHNENLELIISDDGSSDKTIEICSQWIKKNDLNFIHTEIITIEKNTGIPANLNRGVKKARGKWIKLIAGDDILMENCINDNLQAAKKFPSDKIFISNMMAFSGEKENFGKLFVPAGKELCAENGDAKIQYTFLLKTYFGNSPSLFIKNEIFEKLKFDEKISFMEDYPFALNATKAGIRFIYIDKITVGYRIGNSSFNSTTTIFNDFYKKEFHFKENYIFPYATKKIIKYHKFEYERKLFFEKHRLNKKSIVNKILYRLSVYLNPYLY